MRNLSGRPRKYEEDPMYRTKRLGVPVGIGNFGFVFGVWVKNVPELLKQNEEFYNDLKEYLENIEKQDKADELLQNIMDRKVGFQACTIRYLIYDMVMDIARVELEEAITNG